MKNSVQLQPTRREFLGGLGAGVAFIALPGCRAAPAISTEDGKALLDKVAWNLLELEPGSATGLGVDTGEHAVLRSQLGDTSAEGIARYEAMIAANLERVREVDTAEFDPATRTSFEVVESAYSTALEGFKLPYGDIPVGSWRTAPYIVIQNAGAYLDIPSFLDSSHPVENAADAEAYLARLEAFPKILDGELDRLRQASALGVTPPDFALDKAIPQMEQTIAEAREGGPLVDILMAKAGEAGVSGDWEERARAIVAEQVGPALERQLEELRNQRARATHDAGISYQPRGEEWYQWSLKSSTTTELSADEIHRLGLDTLAELQAEMMPIFDSLGLEGESVGARMRALAQDPRFRFAEGDPGRAEIMAFIQERVDWIRAQMPRAFRTLAPGNLEVKRMPLSSEPGAPSAYGGSGSIDGKIPGRMWVNLRTTDLHRRYDVPTLVHHETIPGHVWEGEYSNQLPLIRTRLAFNAFSEGWALYAEQLADELGAYADFPAGRLGYLQNQAWRAARLVVDTGLHSKQWTREQGIEYFAREIGLSEGETIGEIERYCTWPGQACGYMVGKLTIVAERERAKQALGSAYDLRDFNQAVVEGGNAPLDVVARNIDRYIARAAPG
ncbi:MAG TPA: DUF885 domain-containing protein [Sphingomonadaceae bacterium]|nr:DUF885 domain-containing protein [Sphingomonadaceae bacterium]